MTNTPRTFSIQTWQESSALCPYCGGHLFECLRALGDIEYMAGEKCLNGCSKLTYREEETSEILEM